MWHNRYPFLKNGCSVRACIEDVTIPAALVKVDGWPKGKTEKSIDIVVVIPDISAFL